MKRTLLFFIGLLMLLSSTYSSADIKVMVLAGNISQVEFPVLQKFGNVEGEKLIYEQTKGKLKVRSSSYCLNANRWR